MELKELIVTQPQPLTPSAGVKDVVAVGFRHRRLLLGVFSGVVAIALLWALFVRTYDSEMKLLVSKERVDPIVSSDQNNGTRIIHDNVTDGDLNSEIELLTSKDVLRQVVLENQLQNSVRRTSLSVMLAPPSRRDEVRIEKAVRTLEERLIVEPSKKSNVIVVHYRASSPQRAQAVLNSLAKFYFEKHLGVRRPAGQFAFFEQQAEQYHAQLMDAEAQLAAFPKQTGVVSGPLERDSIVQKLADMKVTLETTRAGIAEAQKRVATLQQQIAATPARMTTAQRSADNPQLLQKLKGTLLDLQLKRTELLQKYEPTYRPVQQVEQQIKETEAAIEAAKTAPLRDVTTDADPTHQWMRSELAKAKTELRALQAREAVTSNSIRAFEQQAAQLNASSIEQAELIRNVKALEENYQLYSRKREQARIDDALDRSRILNVAMAEPPTLPAMPQHPPAAILSYGVVLAILLSGSAAFISELMDHSFRTPQEVERYLQVPVVAALPAGNEWPDKDAA
ncbi:MAG: GumC family protein [Terriglobales bacterium]